MILDQIMANNLRELEVRRLSSPLDELKQVASEQPPPLDFALALRGDCIKRLWKILKKYSGK